MRPYVALAYRSHGARVARPSWYSSGAGMRSSPLAVRATLRGRARVAQVARLGSRIFRAAPLDATRSGSPRPDVALGRHAPDAAPLSGSAAPLREASRAFPARHTGARRNLDSFSVSVTFRGTYWPPYPNFLKKLFSPIYQEKQSIRVRYRFRYRQPRGCGGQIDLRMVLLSLLRQRGSGTGVRQSGLGLTHSPGGHTS